MLGFVTTGFCSIQFAVTFARPKYVVHYTGGVHYNGVPLYLTNRKLLDCLCAAIEI